MKYKKLIFLFSFILLNIITANNLLALTFPEKIAASKIYETNLTTPTFLLLLIFVFILFLIPRKNFLLPFILVASFIPADQRFIFGGIGFTEGLDFTIMRILIIAGVARIFIRREVENIKITTFDKIFISWAIGKSIIYIIQYLTVTAFVNRCGFLFDALGLYWLFRQSIRSWSDIRFVIKGFALCIIFMIPFIVYERITAYNPFSVFGRVASSLRAGGIRAEASFSHPIIMGLFWATQLPLFIGMAKISKRTKMHLVYWCAAISAIIASVASNSSTPMATVIIILLIMPFFKWRKNTWKGVRILFWLAVFIQIFKSATGRPPIWHIVARMQITSVSTGWYRYKLIDEFIKRFNEWWLLGTRSTAHWAGSWGYTADITNQYVLEGVYGGILGLSLFAAILVIAFRCLVRHFQISPSSDEQMISWCLWVTLIEHIVSFVGVSHFGQINILWYLQLAMIGFIYEEQIISKPLYFSKNIPE